ncbi:uncharacterized protein LOC117182972 [Belonocnema kinseyi]|uniref:uncharacterized protein LOC117182972 n=1 Tax=Belonocnema kinseyi TaxID=2817044 RepID=UPI00143DF996|nr:uncharacterized protein LOC117182972 [Belonocnema kinseyi]
MAIYAVGAALTTIFNSGGKKDGNVESYLSDAGRMLSDLHYNISITKRSFITPIANKLVKDLAEELPTSSKLLLGEDFPARIKAVLTKKGSTGSSKSCNEAVVKIQGPAQEIRPESEGTSGRAEIQSTSTIPAAAPLLGKCRFLGWVFNSKKFTVELPREKRENILKLAKRFGSKSRCGIRDFAQCIGVLISACQGVKYGWLYAKIMERHKYLELLKAKGNFDGLMGISTHVKTELKWWSENILSVNNPIRFSIYQLEIFSDASLSGWGAFFNGEKTHGWWNTEEQKEFISLLELRAAFNGLRCFAENYRSCQILLRIDSTTAISYINCMGGVQYPKLNSLARLIWQWCEKRDLWIFASYIKSKDNSIADSESRILPPETEWELNQGIFVSIQKKFGRFNIDSFAININKKCQKFISWFKDAGSIAVDAFTGSWSTFFFYAFPPFSLILKVLRKIIEDQAEDRLIDLSFQESPSSSQQSYPGGRQFVGQGFQRRGVPDTATPLMIDSLSKGTIKQYEKPLRLWWDHCEGLNISPFEASVSEVLDFLSNVYKLIGTYGTIYSYRSAVSLVMTAEIGGDSLVKRFFKAVSVARPQKPRYECTWEPHTVLEYLKTLYPNENISIRLLTQKLLMLLALVTSQRIAQRIKTSKVNKAQPCLVIPFFKDQPPLCVASTLKVYINRTSDFRNSVDELFLTCKKPFRAATRQFLARRLKVTLDKSGIDTSLFKAHSTRHASTSAANRQGLNIDHIRQTAGWSNKSSVFAIFYNKPVHDKAKYAQAILRISRSNRVEPSSFSHNGLCRVPIIEYPAFETISQFSWEEDLAKS